MSGLLKCLSAIIPAKQAQSSILPASVRQCMVNRRAQTLNKLPEIKGYDQSGTTDRSMLPTRCPARIHRDSLSTASLLRNTLSSIRVIVTSSSEGLFPLPKVSAGNIKAEQIEHTYSPTRFVFAWRHGWDLGMYHDCTFKRSLWGGFNHFCWDMG